MREHMLTRNGDNKPACICGYTPHIAWRSVESYEGQNMQLAKIAVHEHIERATDLPDRPKPVSDPAEVGAERVYPRALVSRHFTGLWQITWWDAPGVEYCHADLAGLWRTRDEAISQARLVIGAHRKTGTRLNGLAAA